MIRINLLGDRIDNSQSYALQILCYVSALGLSVFLCTYLQGHVNEQLSTAKDDVDRMERKIVELDKITREVAGLEKNKRTLREKILTISNLKAKKHGPVHVLDDLNLALPERSWLLSAKEKSGSLEITGIALDDQVVSTFMQVLEKSDYFGNVDLIISNQQLVNNVKLKQFTVLAQMENPFVRLIPKEELKIKVEEPKKKDAGAKKAKPKLDI